jgi:ClpX C4-type zinc finger
MNPILPKPAERFRAAFRLLTKRGDAAVHCSFCGCNRDKGVSIIAGPGVAICWDCARIAANIAYDTVMEPVTAGRTRLTVAPVFAPGEKLSASQRSALHETLMNQMAGHGCELLTYHYVCSHHAAGDYLGFNVACANDIDTGALQKALKGSCRRALDLPVIAEDAT